MSGGGGGRTGPGPGSLHVDGGHEDPTEPTDMSENITPRTTYIYGHSKELA